MAKSKTFKRIAALATAIALVVCFAVSASAVEVATTTQYVTGDETKVNVTVNVTDATGADYVTYYATKSGSVVYVDQVAVTDGEAEIKYQTAETNLKGDVKVGYTGGTDALDKAIDANTVTANDVEVKVLPTEAVTASFEFSYAPADGKTVDTVTSDDAVVEKAEYTAATGKISVTLSSIDGDVALKVAEKDKVSAVASADIIDAAAIVVGDATGFGEDAANTAEEGDRKITIIGKALNAENYGVVVSENALATEYASMAELEAAGDVYEALGSVTESGDRQGLFAVQIIDQATDAADKTIVEGKAYHVAVYVVEDGKCKLSVYASTISAQ